MKKLETFSLSEILLEPQEGADWLVEDFIPPGLHVFAGPPKAGKSWFALGAGLAVSEGDLFLGFTTSKCGVLYLALEDPRKRIKQRVWKLIDEATGDFDFAIVADTISNGLKEQVEDFIHEHPQTRLVIIDTFQMVRDSKKKEQYAADYSDLLPLKQLADENNIAVIVIHHTRKMGDADVFNTVSGTNGIMGCADSTMVFSNTNRSDGTATLTLTGRDVDFLELKLRFRDCRWELIERTSKEELEERGIPESVLKTINFIHKYAGLWQGTTVQLIEAVGINDISPAAYGKYLAQHSQFMFDRGVDYKNKHTRNGTLLTLFPISTGDDDE